MSNPVQPIWPTAGAPTTGIVPSPTLIDNCNYYVRRLIFQYADKPNAQRLIAILAKQALCDDLPDQLQTAFDLDTAVGPQLDVLGKYIGASRVQGAAISPGYFSLWDGTSTLDLTKYKGTWDPASDTPTIPAAAAGNAGWWYVASDSGSSSSPIVEDWVCGDVLVSNGTVWSRDTNDCGNGLTDGTDLSINANPVFYGYGQSSGQVNALTDASYRVVLKLKSITNTSDGTLASIMSILNAIFPGQISLVDNQDMTLTYSVASTVPLPASILAKFLPRPMGVGITVVIVTPTPAPGGFIITEGGDVITTEGGAPITLE